jgi:ribonuclease J
LGFLTVPEGALVDPKKATDLPDNRVVYMTTGSQGEPMAGLSRMANREHPTIAIGEGDTVILASSLIPGNENAVYRVINGLIDLGANVIHKGNARVHVSGHAASGELLYAYNIVKPEGVIPVHGEARHLRANADIAKASGVASDRVLIGENGTVFDLQNGVATITGQVDIGFVYVDGSTVGEITDADLKDRRILAEEGFISIFLAIDAQTGKIVVGPEIHARGFAPDDAIFDEVKPQIISALEDAAKNGVRDSHSFAQTVRRTVGRWVSTKHRRKPMIVPIVIEA